MRRRIDLDPAVAERLRAHQHEGEDDDATLTRLFDQVEALQLAHAARRRLAQAEHEAAWRPVEGDPARTGSRRILFEAAAHDVYRYLPPQDQRRIQEALEDLSADPHGTTTRLDLVRLDEAHLYCLRVGDWALIYAAPAQRLLVLQVTHRSEGHGLLHRL